MKAVSLAGPLLVLAALLAALFASYQPRPPKPGLHPTKLERTCAFRGAWMPCFIVDEALQTQWDI